MNFRKSLYILVTLAIASISVVGGVTSANAAAVTPITDLPPLEVNTLTPAFSMGITQTTGTSVTTNDMTYIQLTAADWAPQICTGNVSQQPLSTCGLRLFHDNVEVTNVVVSHSAGTSVLTILFPRGSYPIGWDAGVGSVWRVDFAAGAFLTSGLVYGTFSFKEGGNQWNAGTSTWAGPIYVDTADKIIVNFTKVTFAPNGGSGTLTSQQARTNTALTSVTNNNLSRAGFTFGGWATSQANADAGTVAYADGANYNFGSVSRTLYAIWTPIPGYVAPSSGNTPSETTTLAQTGKNPKTMLLEGIAALSLVAMGLLLISSSMRNKNKA